LVPELVTTIDPEEVLLTVAGGGGRGCGLTKTLDLGLNE
jgi:hypothetical protein